MTALERWVVLLLLVVVVLLPVLVSEEGRTKVEMTSVVGEEVEKEGEGEANGRARPELALVLEEEWEDEEESEEDWLEGAMVVPGVSVGKIGVGV